MSFTIPRMKRKRTAQAAGEYAKKRRLARPASYYPAKRSGYSTVPRTRGVYAQGEMKYFDSAKNATSIVASTDWTGTEFQPALPAPADTFFCPTVGSAINQRIAREAKVMKIKIRGIVGITPQTGQSAGDVATTIRVLLVQDTQTNATQVQGEEVMAAPLVASAFNNVETFQSLANFGRFKVLKDKIIVLQNPNMANDTGATGGLVQQGLQKFFKMNHNFKVPASVRFNAVNGGTISDVVDNSWTLLATCTNASSLSPSLSFQARVCYKG